MSLTVFNLLAQAGGASQQSSGAQLMQTVILFVAFGLLMYFFMIRPQQKRAKEQEAMLKTLKAGDKVVTTSGIVGVVVAVKERTVSLRSGDAKLEVVKSSIADVTDRDAASHSESETK